LQTLPTTYLLEISRQLAFLGAFLGGFASTFYVTLLGVPTEHKAAAWALRLSALSACSLIVSVTASVMLTVTLHPDAPASVQAASSLVSARVVSSMGFGVGILALLASLGTSGFMKSRRIGLATSLFSSLGIALVLWGMTGFR